MPNKVFFSPGETVDLNEDFQTTGRNYEAKGLIELFDGYKFTVEENTPLEEEVALDPELLGKVFENLLASYNAETKTTARKKSGSFYTPREVVDYMVDEALVAYFLPRLQAVSPPPSGGKPGALSLDLGVGDGELDLPPGVPSGPLAVPESDAGQRLRHLFAYGAADNPFTPAETDVLIQAIEGLRAIDPACGSGAFPMGLLQKLMHVLHRLDPDNARWKAQNRRPLEARLAAARQVPDPSRHETEIGEAEAALARLDRDFSGANRPDYARKLYLIDKCLFGVDVHPIFGWVADAAKLRAMLAEAGREGGSAEISILLPDGGAAPANLSIAELSVEEGADRMFCLIVTDLRHNYARARELSEANERLASEIADRTRIEQSLAIALDAAEMGSWDLDLSTGGAIRSATHDAIFGDDDQGGPWSLDRAIEHFVPEDREAVVAAFQTARTSGRLDFEKRIRRARDGAVRWVHVRGSTFYGDEGPERIAGIIVDNTDRRLVDEQLRQGQKMEAIGQLTGGIAHDFNNLLMIIGGSLESLSRRVQLDERVQRLLDAAQMGVARGAKLNEQLLSFARRQDMHDEVLFLPDLLPKSETLLDRAVGEAVAVRLDLASDTWFCKADPHQLETAVLNLAINARDAMEGVGALTLFTSNATITAAEAETYEASAGDYVVLTVSDDGPGMSPEVAARVFEPFFTTKALGKGTGLGLSQVYGFARQSGGFVKLESTQGAGASISIYLPRCAPSEEGVKPAQAFFETGQAVGSVLLVEDDPEVRAATSAMLEELGYSITAAGSGDQALEILRSGAGVDIVFSDVIMASGMNRIELARSIRSDHPHLPILLTSGYTAQWMVPSAINSDLPLLRKPYTLAQLSEALARVSASAGALEP